MSNGRVMTPTRVILGVVVISWVALALTTPWDTLADHRSDLVIVTLTVWGWSLWTLSMIALLVPSPVSLTVMRCCAPIALFTSFLAVSPGAIFFSIVTMMISFSPLFADVMVQGGAYGEERRFSLKTPVPSMVPTLIAWAILTGTLLGGTLLISAHQFTSGIPLTLVGVVLATRVPRLLHRHSRRWLVIVPAGVVVHDHYVLAETIMSPRSKIERIDTVTEVGETADFTGGVAGRRLSISLKEPDKVVVSTMTAKMLKISPALHVKTFTIAPRRLSAARASITL